jgi:hypothetical protein
MIRPVENHVDIRRGIRQTVETQLHETSLIFTGIASPRLQAR